jgi:hypothetical protein
MFWWAPKLVAHERLAGGVGGVLDSPQFISARVETKFGEDLLDECFRLIALVKDVPAIRT